MVAKAAVGLKWALCIRQDSASASVPTEAATLATSEEEEEKVLVFTFRRRHFHSYPNRRHFYPCQAWHSSASDSPPDDS